MAIAIALHEAGASNQESPAESRRTFRRVKSKAELQHAVACP